MAEFVYMSAAVLSIVCAVMLFRGYARNKLPLLLWSSLCFLGLSLNNALLFLDLSVIPDINFAVARGLSALVGLALLVYGLVAEASTS